jgi:hypothetical protein
MLGNSGVAERLAASQERLISMQLSQSSYFAQRLECRNLAIVLLTNAKKCFFCVCVGLYFVTLGLRSHNDEQQKSL